MTSSQTSSNPGFQETPDAGLPSFLREMADRFRSRQSNTFLLTGNITDLIDGLGVTCPADQPGAAGRYVYLDQYLAARLESRGRLVVTYNIARGIALSGPANVDKLRTFYCIYDQSGPVEDLTEQKRRSMRFDRSLGESQVYSFLTLRFLEELCRLVRQHPAAAPGRLSILVKHAETILPDAPLSSMADIDRQKLTLLREWLTDPEFTESGEQLILLATTAASIHNDLRSLPQVAAINVPLPDHAAREAFMEWMRQHGAASNPASPSPAHLAGLTAGMTLLTLQDLVLKALLRNGIVEERDVLEALNRLLTSELGDKIEMIRPAHTMSDVIGATALKAELDRIRRLLDTRDPRVAPVGILVTGPNGVGKTYIFEAWAAECDRLVIVLKNLRSMYFGQTDQIFEKLRNVLEALGNVIVFIDEADTVFGRPGRDTHETEARLFGNLVRMMGDPKNRGRIVWILLTARPDNLAPDLKRSGRAGLHLPVFDPEGPDRSAYIDSILQRAGFDPTKLDKVQREAIERETMEHSPADFNEVLVELRAEKLLAGRLTHERIMEILSNILPGQIAAQRRIQTLQAFLECSRRSLIPPSLRAFRRVQAERDLDELKGRMG